MSEWKCFEVNFFKKEKDCYQDEKDMYLLIVTIFGFGLSFIYEGIMKTFQSHQRSHSKRKILLFDYQILGSESG